MIFMNLCHLPGRPAAADTIDQVASSLPLRVKINLIVGATTLLFVGVLLGLQFKDMRNSVHEEVVAANRVTSQLLSRTVGLQNEAGTQVLLRFLQGVGRVRSNDITLFDAAGAVLYRSPPSTYKAGRAAPRWFDAMVSPPPSVQATDLSDGRLTVRSNASRAVLDAWDEFVPLLGASLALLLGVNAFVFWVVGRTVRPFGRIVSAMNEVEAGRFDVTLPTLPGREASAIGAAFNRMVGMLHEHIETERRAVHAERELSDRRELGRWIEQRLDNERRLIARELHDELGQSVTAIRSMALSVAQRVHGIDAESEQAARLIAAESSRLYDAMHGMIPRLTPLVLDRFGLTEALQDLAQRSRLNHPELNIQLDLDLADTPVAGDAALALYRAAQEGITNALRHGRAKRVSLNLRASAAGELTLDVIDDGQGLPSGGMQRNDHHGLRWMAERVDALGGQFSIAAAHPGGVHLCVRLPCRSASPA